MLLHSHAVLGNLFLSAVDPQRQLPMELPRYEALEVQASTIQTNLARAPHLEVLRHQVLERQMQDTFVSGEHFRLGLHKVVQVDGAATIFVVSLEKGSHGDHELLMAVLGSGVI